MYTVKAKHLPKRANRYYIQIYESCLMRLWCTGKRFVGCKMFSRPMDTYEMTFLSLTSWSKAILNIEMPCSWHEAMPASSECSFEFGWCRCVGVLLFLSYFFFFSSQFHFQSIVLAVVQGHYVMLIRAPHLEKCHWDTEFAELILEMKTCLWKTLVTKDTEPKRNSAGE